MTLSTTTLEVEADIKGEFVYSGQNLLGVNTGKGNGS